ncbi:MAG: hypothetical protein KJ655_03005, partial [Candidatus Thermoplasmatota archaeon]|nr:hypothetical protein [Candidatus Thermoplasmatota archaeon]
MCYKIFGGAAKSFTKKNYKLKDNLAKARIEMLPEAYMSCTWMNTLIGAVSGIVIGIIIREILLGLEAMIGKPILPPVLYTIIPVILPCLLAGTIYLLCLTSPLSK